MQGLARHAVDDSPRGVTRQVVGWARAESDLTRLDGTPLVDFAAEVPVLAFGATKDRLVSHEDVALTCERLPQCTYVALEGMGHVDPVLGISAPEQVFAPVLAWLDAQRASYSSPTSGKGMAPSE